MIVKVFEHKNKHYIPIPDDVFKDGDCVKWTVESDGTASFQKFEGSELSGGNQIKLRINTEPSGIAKFSIGESAFEIDVNDNNGEIESLIEYLSQMLLITRVENCDD